MLNAPAHHLEHENPDCDAYEISNMRIPEMKVLMGKMLRAVGGKPSAEKRCQRSTRVLNKGASLHELI